MKKLLCWLGFHKWIVISTGLTCFTSKRECTKCGKEQFEINGWWFTI